MGGGAVASPPIAIVALHESPRARIGTASQVRIATMDFDFSPRQVIVLLLAGCASVAGRSLPVPSPFQRTGSQAGGPWSCVSQRSPRPARRGCLACAPSPRAPADRISSLAARADACGRLSRRIGPGHALDGVASFYWQGQKTASGEAFDRSAMTAAHPTLPFNSRVRVTHLQTGRSVEVRINDRGPFKPGRVIDLSQRAAEELGITARGLARVRLEVVSN